MAPDGGNVGFARELHRWLYAGEQRSGSLFSRLIIALGVLLLIVGCTFAGVIAFSTPAAPPVLATGNSIPGMAQWNFADLPKVQTLKARDGVPIKNNLYPGREDRAVVLVHSSTGSGVEMLKLAQTLQAAGATVCPMSLRGHGGSGTANGDVAYLGQLDDDLADLVKGLGLDRPGMHRTLAGFSSGGELVLRIAGGPQASLFDDYLALSPYITRIPPTNKPNSGGWAGVAMPRIVALSLLKGGRRTWPGSRGWGGGGGSQGRNNRTPVYSFRLVASLQLGRDWRAVLARIKAPTAIVIGANDELFNADQFQPTMQAINPRIGVTVVPNEGHLAMIADPAATTAIAGAWRKLAGD